jgi:hypothetical protein
MINFTVRQIKENPKIFFAIYAGTGIIVFQNLIYGYDVLLDSFIGHFE